MDLTTCLPRGWLGDEGFPVASPCPCGLTGAPSEHHRPGCDRTAHPQLEDETLALVNAAVESLARRRGSAPGDAGATLSCLASLIAEAQSRLPDAVAAALAPGADPWEVPAAGPRGTSRTLWLIDENAASRVPQQLVRKDAAGA